MNNRGYAVTGILYTILLIALSLIIMMLYNLQNKKTILDALKADTVDAVEENNNFEYVFEKINNLQNEIDTLKEGKADVSIVSSLSAVNEWANKDYSGTYVSALGVWSGSNWGSYWITVQSVLPPFLRDQYTVKVNKVLYHPNNSGSIDITSLYRSSSIVHVDGTIFAAVTNSAVAGTAGRVYYTLTKNS